MNTDARHIELTADANGVEFGVKVVPGSSRDRIVGVWNMALRVAVTAPAEASKANRAMVRLLADTFGVNRSDVTITHGQRRPLKRVRITGLSSDRVRQVVAAAVNGAA